MDRETTRAEIARICAERFGDDVAAALMKRARPGFALTPAASEREAAGHSRHGGSAMFAPGTPWPTCDGHPLSLIAVIDTDALAPWLDGVLPPGTGLLNFFALDSHSEQATDEAVGIAGTLSVASSKLGAVIAAASGEAVAVDAPKEASVFEARPWAAEPGFGFPDDWDPAFWFGELDADVMVALLGDRLADFRELPGVITTGDIAFGWPELPTGGSLSMELGVDPKSLHHLLQLDGARTFTIGGEGGIMHWSIPSAALAEGDFTKAIPTPDLF
ncbi:MAG TPA: DUF1963 domain-containing protein [Phytomonospora sp.]